MFTNRVFSWTVLTLLLLLAGNRALAAGLEAELVIFNGKILTADSPDLNNFRTAQAAAIYGGRFVAVGTNNEVLPYAGPGTKKIDLGGRTVIPGLVETHNHIYSYASHFFPKGAPRVGVVDPPINFTGKDEVLAQLRTIALTKKPGEWIITSASGGELAMELATRRGEISRLDLDRVTPNNPVHFNGSGTDQGMVNTKALELLLARYPNVQGIIKDARGSPTGETRGVANLTITYEFYPQVAPEKLAPYYKMEMEEIAAQGLTTVSTRLFPNELTAYSWMYAQGDMPLRMAYSLEAASRSSNPEAIISRLVGLQGGSGDKIWGAGDDHLWMIGLSPISIDGTPGPGGSCINKEYPRENVNFPLWRFQYYGPNGLCRLVDPDYTDADLIRAAARYGFRITGMHSGGDRGIDQFLDIVEQMSQQYPDVVKRRWAIDHCRFLNDDHARRSQKLGIYFSCGPKYVYAGQRGDIGAYAVIYGPEVAADSVVPMRRLIDHGLRTTMQLDQHAFHPFLAFQVVVTRKDITGKVWGPQQRISRLQALYTYTRWSAEYVLKEKLLGSIEPNKLADFVVLNRDYLTVPEDEIGRIDPVLTVVGGKPVYTDPQFAVSVGLPTVGYQGARSHWRRGIPEDANRRGAGEGGG